MDSCGLAYPSIGTCPQVIPTTHSRSLNCIVINDFLFLIFLLLSVLKHTLPKMPSLINSVHSPSFIELS